MTGALSHYIWAFDSKGREHPEVMKVLIEYLELEARGRQIPWTDESRPVGKHVAVSRT